jgi:ribonuclease P protein component
MNPNGGTPRFGFIVAKTVGNAVVRNRTRRRMKAIAHELAPALPEGSEFVFRALPQAATVPFSELKSELEHSSAKLSVRG